MQELPSNDTRSFEDCLEILLETTVTIHRTFTDDVTLYTAGLIVHRAAPQLPIKSNFVTGGTLLDIYRKLADKAIQSRNVHD